VDDHDMDPHGMDPHGMEPPEPDHGLGPEPDQGLDHPDPADHEWPDTAPASAELGDEDAELGHEDADLGHEGDLDSADTAHLGFAEEYDHPFGDPADGGLDAASHLHTPAGYADLPADLPDLLGTFDTGEAPFGADPDLYPLTGSDLGDDQAFPPSLELDPPEPIDGYPWADPSALGQDLLPPVGDLPADAGAGPEPGELFEYAGELPPAGGDAWAALLASDDPATSALARWWSS
jgi:hypothetical protein